MKNKLWLGIISLGIFAGVINLAPKNILTNSVSAQSRNNESLVLEEMDVEKLDAILREAIPNVQVQSGQWRFSINEVSLIVIADSRANRMRIIAPITQLDKIDGEQAQNMMTANFHTALDARYAISRNLVVATYLHPLNSLQKRDLLSAVNQVASLASTFGTTYSSGELLFAPGGGRERQIPGSEDNISI